MKYKRKTVPREVYDRAVGEARMYESAMIALLERYEPVTKKESRTFCDAMRTITFPNGQTIQVRIPKRFKVA